MDQIAFPGKVAFLGTGQMGAAMVERLIDAGNDVHVYDPNPAAMKPLAERGATASGSVADCVAGAKVAFACLPSPEASQVVALGEGGVAGTVGLEIYVEMSTIGSEAIENIEEGLAKHGVTVIDAPVSGGPRGARAGLLTTMVAGERAAFETVKPLLETMARNVFYMSDTPGHGQITKVANNMVSAAGMSAAAEATVMAVKAGLDARVLIDVMNASTGRNSATEDKFPQSILPRTFDYGGKLATMHKDVTLCFEEAKRLDVPMWVGSSVVQLWFHAMCEGRGDDDYTTIIKVIEDWAGGVVVGDGKPAAD